MKLVALLAVVSSALAAAEPTPTAPELPEQRVKRLIDRYRAAAGLPGVEIDPKLTKGCMQHAEYMRLNRNTDAVLGLNAHRQRPNLPGATRAGAACAKGADVFAGVSDLDVAVDAWMAGLYHRRPILAPTLGKIGVGYAKLPDGMYMAVLAFADGTDPSLESKWPVAYPGNKQTDVPLDFSNEVPNPIPGGGRAGYPITFQFPPFDKVTGAKATLTADGKPVAFYLSSPERPATGFRQHGMVCLIPKAPLSPNTKYEVRVEAIWNGKPVSQAWSFTTVSLRPVDAHDEAAMEKAINVASTVRGTTVLAGWANGQIAFLQIGEKKLRRYKMISVLIPRAVWLQLGGARLVGKTIEVDGTPYLVEGKFLNVPITVASQLRVVK